jgi:hypothetical protein
MAHSSSIGCLVENILHSQGLIWQDLHSLMCIRTVSVLLSALLITSFYLKKTACKEDMVLTLPLCMPPLHTVE